MALELENSRAYIMRTSLVAACGLSCGMWNLRDQTQDPCQGSPFTYIFNRIFSP